MELEFMGGGICVACCFIFIGLQTRKNDYAQIGTQCVEFCSIINRVFLWKLEDVIFDSLGWCLACFLFIFAVHFTFLNGKIIELFE